LAFADTIEHEAANDSGLDRTILIFDAWKPELNEEERALVPGRRWLRRRRAGLGV
jgi:aspartate beta-hydroxylase